MLTLRTAAGFDLVDRLEQQLQTAERVPAAEVHDTEEAYELVLELPGVDKDAIEVKATDRTLVISAQRRNPRQVALEAKGSGEGQVAATAGPQAAGPKAAGAPDRGLLLSEFRYGTWSRSFRFPAGIDRDQLQASYRDGLLSVRAPKAQRVSTVTVKVES
jgi:HSP20 family protein